MHIEACRETREVLRQIRATGAKAGLAIKPGTPYAAVAPYLPDLDVLLVMTVEPGFGGQAFMPEMMEKVSAARDERVRKQLGFVIEVDGGIARPRRARLERRARTYSWRDTQCSARPTRTALAGLQGGDRGLRRARLAAGSAGIQASA